MRALSLLLVASLLPAPSTMDGSVTADKSRTVTLSTGDQVRLRGADQVSIQTAPGREKVRFLAHRLGTGLQIIPVDQLPQIHSG